MKYNPAIVTAFLKSFGLPAPEYEVRFHPERKWRFDLAFPKQMLAVEVQGGIWTRGRHNRGAAMLKEWEKLNTAAAMGWRVMYFQPSDLCLSETAHLIATALSPGQTLSPKAGNPRC